MLTVAVICALAAPQEGPTVFRADTRLVVCHTTVVDNKTEIGRAHV